MNRVAVLGTIEAIARQKAGIYKKDESELRVVKEFFALKDIKLGVPYSFPYFPVGLASRCWRSNASRAVELARNFLTGKLESLYPDPIPGDFAAGLENTK
ncbi:hypothetical protein JVT61DRAFT_12227 [Boletus reticuloceps]|uniref:Uncharacterized protein n=1 Tax=Boletus reticuloceps TaxID=495285 RepID=A0A8I2YEC7_9AGAM|nr:hypothetical protein JVT61DRAFT_12227 [Boletus reticuloceps]